MSQKTYRATSVSWADDSCETIIIINNNKQRIVYYYCYCFGLFFKPWKHGRKFGLVTQFIPQYDFAFFLLINYQNQSSMY